MQSTALAVSPSTSFLKPPCRNSFLNASQLSPSTSLIQVDNLTEVHRLSCQTALYTFSSSNASFIFSNRRYDHLKVRAASVLESADDASKQSWLVKTLQLGSMFGIWYLLNIYFYIYSKQKLEFEGQSLFIDSESIHFQQRSLHFSLAAGLVMIILMWALNLYPRPNLT